MAGFGLYLAGIVGGVFLAIYGIDSRKWLAFFAGALIAIVSTYTAGII